MQNIIETNGLTRCFGRLTAVHDLDLRVPRASVYGFLGPNGAGKTTTIRMLLGLIQPDSGKVAIFGESIREARLEILARLGAMVEAPASYPHLTGRENLEIIRRLRALPKTSISQALSIVRLEEDANRLVKQYSTGMKQRLGLAIALMGQPELLILDEPTNGLDPAGIHADAGFDCAPAGRVWGHSLPVKPPAERGGAGRHTDWHHPNREVDLPG